MQTVNAISRTCTGVSLSRRGLIELGWTAAGAAGVILLGGCTAVTPDGASPAAASPTEAAAESPTADSTENPPANPTESSTGDAAAAPAGGECLEEGTDPPTEEIGAIDWEQQFLIVTEELQGQLTEALKPAGALGEELASALTVAVFFYFTEGKPILDPSTELETLIYAQTLALQERLIAKGLPEDQARQIVISRLDLVVDYRLEEANNGFAPVAAGGRPLLRVSACTTTYVRRPKGYCIRTCKTTYSC